MQLIIEEESDYLQTLNQFLELKNNNMLALILIAFFVIGLGIWGIENTPSLQVGDKVIYKEEMKGLPKDSVGVIQSIKGKIITVAYPDYLPIDKDNKITYSNNVYLHSVTEDQLILVDQE